MLEFGAAAVQRADEANNWGCKHCKAFHGSFSAVAAHEETCLERMDGDDDA